mgnify:CR=1 FL=1
MTELRLYTMEEVAKILSVSKKAVYTYIREGKLPAIRIGKYWRVTEEGLREILTKGTTSMKESKKEGD